MTTVTVVVATVAEEERSEGETGDERVRCRRSMNLGSWTGTEVFAESGTCTGSPEPNEGLPEEPLTEERPGSSGKEFRWDTVVEKGTRPCQE